MKRSSLLVTVLAVLSLASVGTAAAHPRAARLHVREHRMEGRIHQGARSGELTRPETWRLRGRLCRLQAREARFRWDGHLSPGERRALNRQANRLSREVCRLKHNHRSRF